MNGTLRPQTFPTHDASETDGSTSSSFSPSASVSSRPQHFMEGSPFAFNGGSTSFSHATTPATTMIERERRYYRKELPPFIKKWHYPRKTHLAQTVRLLGEGGEYTGVEIHINIRNWDQEHIFFVSLVNGEEQVLQICTKVRSQRHFRVWLGHETGASDTILAYTSNASRPQPPAIGTKRSGTGSPIPEATGKTPRFNEADVSLHQSKRGEPSELEECTATGKRNQTSDSRQSKRRKADIRTQQ